MTIIIIFIVLAIIGGILGFRNNNKDKGENAAVGAAFGGCGFLFVLFQILFAICAFALVIAFFQAFWG